MELTLIHQIILGIIQGITEWIPISSSAMTSLVMANFFNITDFSLLLQKSLFLHLGTFFAALVYFRKDVTNLFVSLFNYKKSSTENKNILKFLIISTLITGVLGILIYSLLLDMDLEFTGQIITLGIGGLLLITGGVQLIKKIPGIRKESDLKLSDSILLGTVQGISTLPGISRSGITTSTLLLKKFNDTSALRLSFIMSLPVVLFANLLLNANELTTGLNLGSLLGLLASFIFGLLTIHALMNLSKKINFAWFVLIFAALMILSVLI